MVGSYSAFAVGVIGRWRDVKRTPPLFYPQNTATMLPIQRHQGSRAASPASLGIRLCSIARSLRPSTVAHVVLLSKGSHTLFSCALDASFTPSLNTCMAAL